MSLTNFHQPNAAADWSDRALVRRAQTGDRAAFSLLTARYRQRIMNLAMRYMQNREDAEDAVQDIFIRAYWGLARFRGDAAFYSWLHRIAVNASKTALRERARDARFLAPNPLPPDQSSETSPRMQELDTPEELALTDEISDAVNTALDALGAEQRTAIVLREIEGLSYAQVASNMACPVGTVRSRVFRAREIIDQRLRRLFDEGLGRARSKSAHKNLCSA